MNYGDECRNCGGSANPPCRRPLIKSSRQTGVIHNHHPPVPDGLEIKVTVRLQGAGTPFCGAAIAACERLSPSGVRKILKQVGIDTAVLTTASTGMAT
jgi:hypothetical protein